MELMDMKDYDIDFKEKRTNGYLIATLFIIVGILFLLRNLGMIDPSLFVLLVSWPMLLVVSGIFMIFHRNPVGGMLLVGVMILRLDRLDRTRTQMQRLRLAVDTRAVIWLLLMRR